MDTNWSRVGSAQQYQGSVKCGIDGREAIAGGQSMQRAIAKQAEAERERRAKVIHAEGEYEASTKLAEAATIIQKQPAAIQLRYLQTLTEVGAEKNHTIVFPLPVDLIREWLHAQENH